jgi:hypothetical protein
MSPAAPKLTAHEVHAAEVAVAHETHVLEGLTRGADPIQVDAIGSYLYHHGIKGPYSAAEAYIKATPAERETIEEMTVKTLNLPRPGCPYGNCGPVLGPHDVVGTTFYIACNMMLAFALFFFVQVSVVPNNWKTSVNVAGLVTGIAWYNYTYMKEQWVQTQMSPTQYRYTDWLITVPLQITEFYFILKASGPVNPNLGLRLFLTSIAMVFFGWLAEINVLAKLMGFALGCACWLYIVYETFAGEAAAIATKMVSPASKQAFSTLRIIVSVGWSIYPLGFAVAYLCYFDQPAGVLSADAQAALNVTYNLADLVNKGAFGLCCWSAAVSDKKDALLG